MERSYDDELKDRNFGDYIYETPYWIVFLAPNQSNIGTCVVALKRHYGSLSGLKDEEWIDFGKTVKQLETSLKKVFKPTLFNWGALMNADYMKENPDPHIHWHFIPRYRHEVEFEGIIFEDRYFGSMHPRPVLEIPYIVRKRIIETIKKNL
ncbi:MAG: HIT family protein [Methanobacterium sp.]|nr:HIT family protein [Methanobacterium sp.]